MCIFYKRNREKNKQKQLFNIATLDPVNEPSQIPSGVIQCGFVYCWNLDRAFKADWITFAQA